jgi:hypothetical protein
VRLDVVGWVLIGLAQLMYVAAWVVVPRRREASKEGRIPWGLWVRRPARASRGELLGVVLWGMGMAGLTGMGIALVGVTWLHPGGGAFGCALIGVVGLWMMRGASRGDAASSGDRGDASLLEREDAGGA